VYFVVEKSLCSLRSLWLKHSGVFFWEVTLALNLTFSPREGTAGHGFCFSDGAGGSSRHGFFHKSWER
jgi:hypothetical protein